MIRVAHRDDPRLERDLLAREPVRVTGAVPVLVARSHELRHRCERGGGGQDALPDERVLTDEPELHTVQWPGLVEDLVRDRHLADVVKLGGAGHVFEPLRRQPHRATDRQGERRHVVQVGVEVRLALLEDLHEHVARLLAHGVELACALVRVEALVGDLHRGARVARLGGEVDQPMRGRDHEPAAVLRQRVGRRRHDRLCPL